MSYLLSFFESLGVY